MRLSVIAAAVGLGAVGLFGPSAAQEFQTDNVQGGSTTSVMVLASWQVGSVLGKEVRSKADENMGRLVDVIVDRTGRPRAAVIDFGGFLGVGSRKIAIDWNALSFDAGNSDAVIVDMTREQVKAAPEYKDKRAVLVLGSANSALPGD